MKKFALIAGALLALAGPALAFLPRGTVAAAPPGACPYDVNGYADGCDGAPAGGYFQDVNFFTNARQSGQAQYKAAGGAGSNHPPPWNVAGVDYPVGHYTPDVSLKDPIANPPAGCSYNAGLVALQCSGAVTIEHYRLNGINIYMPNAGSSLVLTDNHVTETSANCRTFSGQNPIIVIGEVTATSNTFDFDDTCSITAVLYKQSGDPGFVTQSSGTASLSGTTLTYSAVNSGTVRIGQYIDCAGCTEPARITAGSGLSWTVSVSQPTLSNVTVTTGPVEDVQNGAIGNSGKFTAYYNYDNGWGQFGAPGTAVGDLDARFNYGKLTVRASQHLNFVVKLPGPGTINSWVQNFNTLVWDQHSYINAGGGTSTIDQFATINISGGTTTTVLHQANNNTIVSNTALNPNGTAITNSMLRYLSQGSASAADAHVNGSMTGGVLTVTAVVSGANPITVGQYIACQSCTSPPRVTSFGTGTGGTGTYNVSNTADTKTFTNAGFFSYPGVITTLEWKENYMDMTGTNGGAFTRDTGLVVIGTETILNNINMVSGNLCNVGSCP